MTPFGKKKGRPAFRRQVEVLRSRQTRDKAFAKAYIETGMGYKIQGMMVNRSTTGAMIRFNALSGLVPGDIVTFTVPLKKMKSRAKIVWRDRNDIGLMLDPA